MPIQVDNSPDVPALPAAAPAPGQPEVPASQVDTAKPEEPKPKAKRTRGPSKRKAAAKDAPAPADTADAAKPEAADPAAGAEGDELAPLPDEATGFRLAFALVIPRSRWQQQDCSLLANAGSVSRKKVMFPSSPLRSQACLWVMCAR